MGNTLFPVVECSQEGQWTVNGKNPSSFNNSTNKLTPGSASKRNTAIHEKGSEYPITRLDNTIFDNHDNILALASSSSIGSSRRSSRNNSTSHDINENCNYGGIDRGDSTPSNSNREQSFPSNNRHIPIIQGGTQGKAAPIDILQEEQIGAPFTVTVKYPRGQGKTLKSRPNTNNRFPSSNRIRRTMDRYSSPHQYNVSVPYTLNANTKSNSSTSPMCKFSKNDKNYCPHGEEVCLELQQHTTQECQEPISNNKCNTHTVDDIDLLKSNKNSKCDMMMITQEYSIYQPKSILKKNSSYLRYPSFSAKKDRVCFWNETENENLLNIRDQKQNSECGLQTDDISIKKEENENCINCSEFKCVETPTENYIPYLSDLNSSSETLRLFDLNTKTNNHTPEKQRKSMVLATKNKMVTIDDKPIFTYLPFHHSYQKYDLDEKDKIFYQAWDMSSFQVENMILVSKGGDIRGTTDHLLRFNMNEAVLAYYSEELDAIVTREQFQNFSVQRSLYRSFSPKSELKFLNNVKKCTEDQEQVNLIIQNREKEDLKVKYLTSLHESNGTNDNMNCEQEQEQVTVYEDISMDDSNFAHNPEQNHHHQKSHDNCNENSNSWNNIDLVGQDPSSNLHNFRNFCGKARGNFDYGQQVTSLPMNVSQTPNKITTSLVSTTNRYSDDSILV